MPLPSPYKYSEFDFLAIPDVQEGGYKYMRQPIDTRSNQLVSEEQANHLLREYDLYDELLDELPPELGLDDTGRRKVTDWDVVLRQQNGNVVAIPIVTGGYAQIVFPRTTSAKAVAVLAPDLMNLLLGGTLSVEQIRGMDPSALLVQQFTQLTPAQLATIVDVLKKAWPACNCSGSGDDDIFIVIDVLELVDEETSTTPAPTPTPTPTPTVARYLVRVDVNDCFRVTGWAVNLTNPGQPVPVAIRFDGATVATVTPKNVRPDVAKYLREVMKVAAVDTDLFGFEWIVPEQYRQGTAHKTSVFIDGTAVEAETYNQPQVTGTCGSASGGSPVVIQPRLDGPGSMTAGQTKRFWTTLRLADNSEQRFTGQATYSVDGGTPDGLTLTPAVNGAEVELIYSGGPGKKITLRVQLPDGGQATANVQLVSNVCIRPGGQDYKPMLVFAYAPAAGGNAKIFDSLDEANRVMGRHFDGTEPMLFTPFPAEMVNYNEGTQVYWKWNSESTACEFVSNNIYYVLGGQGQNDQRIAIQVVDTRIVGQKPSDYVTQPAVDPANRVTEIAVTTTTVDYTQTPKPGDNLVDCFALIQVIGNPVVWVGTYTVHRDAADQTFQLTYSDASPALITSASKPTPSEWSRFRFLAGANQLVNEYRARIDVRLNGPTGQLLVSYVFETGLPMLPPKTIYLNR